MKRYAVMPLCVDLIECPVVEVESCMTVEDACDVSRSFRTQSDNATDSTGIGPGGSAVIVKGHTLRCSQDPRGWNYEHAILWPF